MHTHICVHWKIFNSSTTYGGYVFSQQMSKKELLSSDFEGILKYFRVSLPKKYRNEDVARQLFKLATSIKVKKIKKYEKEYLAIKGKFLASEGVVFNFGFHISDNITQKEYGMYIKHNFSHRKIYKSKRTDHMYHYLC